MKVLVIGLDGLEYDLVEKWDLKYLKQERYGKLRIPEEFYHDTERVPYTPKIWSTIITGLPPQKHGGKSHWIYSNRLLEKLRWIPPFKWFKGKRLLLEKLGLKPKLVSFKVNSKTIFDECAPSIALNIVGYNLNVKYNLETGRLIKRGLINEAISYTRKVTRNLFRDFLSKTLKSEWKLAMVYVNILDILGHLCWVKCPDKLERAYKNIDITVGRIISKVRPDISVIISDHGMQRSEDGITGNHSDHMFWSLNIDDEFTSVYDIPNKIVNWCRK